MYIFYLQEGDLHYSLYIQGHRNWEDVMEGPQENRKRPLRGSQTAVNWHDKYGRMKIYLTESKGVIISCDQRCKCIIIILVVLSYDHLWSLSLVSLWCCFFLYCQPPLEKKKRRMRISFNKAPEFFPIPFGIKASSVITVSASLMDWTRTSWIQVGETLEQKIARFGGGGGMG